MKLEYQLVKKLTERILNSQSISLPLHSKMKRKFLFKVMKIILVKTLKFKKLFTIDVARHKIISRPNANRARIPKVPYLVHLVKEVLFFFKFYYTWQKTELILHFLIII